MEGQPRSFNRSDAMQEYIPSTEDIVIRGYFETPEAEAVFQAEMPVSWLRGAIAKGSDRFAGQVSDAEIADRYIGGGILEWDPKVSNAVRSYLIGVGFVITR